MFGSNKAKEKPLQQEPKKVGNFSLVVIALSVTVGVFFLLLGMQKKAVNPYGNKSVYVVKNNLDVNTTISNEDDIEKYFSKKDRRANEIPDGAVTEDSELIGMRLTGNVYKDEIIVKGRLDKIDSILSKIKNKREYCLKVTDIGDVVGGTLREGDIIDITCTYTPSGAGVVRSDVKLQNIYVSSVLSADGTKIERSDSAKRPSVVLNLTLSGQDALTLDNALSQGKVRVQKVIDAETYTPVTVESKK